MSGPARSRSRAIGGVVANLIAFMTAWACASVAIGRLVGFPGVHDIPEKLRLLQTEYRNCEVLFFGSSRVVHQIDPKLFEQKAVEAGRPLRSFNFGLESMWPPESLFVLREVLRQRPPDLKYVAIELMPVDGTLREDQDGMARTIYWHDRRHTRMAEQAVLERYPEWRRRLPLVWRHEVMWMKCFGHLGAGYQIFQQLMAPGPREDHLPRWRAEAGYIKPQDDEEMGEGDRQWFTATLENSGDELSNQEAALPFSVGEAYLPLLSEMRRQGIEPIFFIAPGLNRKTNFKEAPGHAKLISFCRPDLYPELFKPGLYRDRSHLNGRGAAIFTPIFAQKFLKATARP